MTPSEKPERSASSPAKDAEPTSVITQTVEGNDQPSTPSENEAAGASAQDDSGTGSDGAPEDGVEAPPPWQRASARSTEQRASEEPVASGATAVGEAAPAPGAEDTQKIPKPVLDPGFPASGAEQGAGQGRPSGSYDGTAARAQASSTSARRTSRGPRRASLQVKRVDPWSVLKLALVLSVALFFVWMIAVAVLYGVLDGMGVWDQLNGTFTELTQSDDTATEPLISAGRVFGVASIVGAINIVLITALATVAAFIYNVAADFAGGVELTLSERE